jgi:uridylate kinase
VEVLNQVAADVCEAADLGLQLCLVVGGGNIYRGLAAATDGMDRVSGDYMGMLATGAERPRSRPGARSQGPFGAGDVGHSHDQHLRALHQGPRLAHLADGHLLVLVGGTGNPFFTTDTTAALRAAEMGCDAIFKATQVDGVYDFDPAKNPKARRYDALSYDDVLRQDLRIMDGAAIASCPRQSDSDNCVLHQGKRRFGCRLAREGVLDHDILARRTRRFGRMGGIDKLTQARISNRARRKGDYGWLRP